VLLDELDDGRAHDDTVGRLAHGRGLNDSQLVTRVKVDPIMGGTGMNVNFVTFERAADVEAEASSAAVVAEEN